MNFSPIDSALLLSRSHRRSSGRRVGIPERDNGNVTVSKSTADWRTLVTLTTRKPDRRSGGRPLRLHGATMAAHNAQAFAARLTRQRESGAARQHHLARLTPNVPLSVPANLDLLLDRSDQHGTTSPKNGAGLAFPRYG